MNVEWIKTTLANNLKYWRLELGLSQQEIADAASISYRLLQELETAKGNPTIETLFKLAKVFKVTVSQLTEQRFLRLDEKPDSLEVFKNNYVKTFEGASVAVILRTLEGVILYGNKSAEAIFGANTFSSFPHDLNDKIPQELKKIMAFQRGAEKRGDNSPYNLSFSLIDSFDRIFIRCYPTLILPPRGRSPVLASVYLSQITDDNTTNYFRYCDLLFKSFFL